MSLDLTGGYHDAGDHGKFGLPLASTLSTLSWGGIQFEESYAATGQLDDLLEAVRWGTDYLLKAHGRDAAGNTTYLVAQVGGRGRGPQPLERPGNPDDSAPRHGGDPGQTRLRRGRRHRRGPGLGLGAVPPQWRDGLRR